MKLYLTKFWVAIALIVFCQKTFAQKDFLDVPYVEANAKVDTLVVPDRIYIDIRLDEADSKNRRSIEEQERMMQAALRKVGIATEKDLALADLGSDFQQYFLRGQNVVKSKTYTLLVRDAVTAGRALKALEDAQISNVNLNRTEYSRKNELFMALRARAVLEAKKSAENLASPLGQKIGKAVHITENSFSETPPRTMMMAARYKEADVQEEPIQTDFRKMRFSSQVYAKFLLQ